MRLRKKGAFLTTRFKRTAALLTLVGVASPAVAQSGEKPACRMTDDWADGEVELALVANETGGYTGKIEVVQYGWKTGGKLPPASDLSDFSSGLTVIWAQQAGRWRFATASLAIPSPPLHDMDKPARAVAERDGRRTSRDFRFSFTPDDVEVDLGPIASVRDRSFTVSLHWTYDSTDYRVNHSYRGISRGYDWASARYNSLTAAYRRGDCKLVEEGCFLTTAACDGIGLADDCWELRTLRAFRDGWLRRQPGGVEDITSYYDQAPAIAARLRGDRRALVRLYWTRIVPSALAARIGAKRTARRLYTRMMRELGARTVRA